MTVGVVAAIAVLAMTNFCAGLAHLSAAGQASSGWDAAAVLLSAHSALPAIIFILSACEDLRRCLVQNALCGSFILVVAAVTFFGVPVVHLHQ
jgi:hypothetical protein